MINHSQPYYSRIVTVTPIWKTWEVNPSKKMNICIQHGIHIKLNYQKAPIILNRRHCIQINIDVEQYSISIQKLIRILPEWDIQVFLEERALGLCQALWQFVNLLNTCKTSRVVSENWSLRRFISLKKRGIKLKNFSTHKNSSLDYEWFE